VCYGSEEAYDQTCYLLSKYTVCEMRGVCGSFGSARYGVREDWGPAPGPGPAGVLLDLDIKNTPEQ
jgi:hypothetical protein